jgi:chromosome segregation ATPase
MSKGQAVFEKVNTLMEGGMSRPDAFKNVASELDRPVNSVRGTYYAIARASTGGSSRSRRRETTPEAALADARASLERSIASIDREVEIADERAREAKAEHESLQASAAERKALIAGRLDALK